MEYKKPNDMTNVFTCLMKKKFGNGNGSGMDRESIGNGSAKSRNVFALIVLLLLVGVQGVWAGDPITLEDLDFGTPDVSEDFENVATDTIWGNTESTTINTSLTTYGVFTHDYIGKKTTCGHAISAAATPMTSKHLCLMIGASNGACMSFSRSFSSSGAFSFKIAKTSYTYIGLYDGVASNTFVSGTYAAVYLEFSSANGIRLRNGSDWTPVLAAANLPSTDILDITVIYNKSTATTYGDGISLGNLQAHVYVNGDAIMDGDSPKAFTIPNKTLGEFRIGSSTTCNVRIDDIKIYDALPTAAESCSNTVSLSKGSESNGTISLGSTSIATCNETASTRQVTLTVTPSTGYAAPTGDDPLTFTSGTVTATYKSGPTGSGPYTYVYEFDQDDSGEGTFGVTCTARTYTITLDNQSATTAGTESVTVTYNSSSNLTSAITKPTKTGYTFGGYYTMASGAGTQIIDADGNFNTNPGSSGTYTDASKNWKYTGDLELHAKWTAINYTITWMVDGSEWTPYTTTGEGQNGSTSAAYGTRVSKLPTAPTKSDGCGDEFVGWSTKNAGSEAKTTSYYNDLFETTGTSPVITQNTTFYAVFADYDD